MSITGDLDYDVYRHLYNRYGNDTNDAALLPLLPSGLHVVLSRYVFPFQFVFGVLGNILNLLVLLGRNMRSEANIYLSAMAISDICLFVSYLPYSLAVIEYFYTWNAYRIFFYKVQVLCLYLSNVFSSMTSYFILAVSVERSFGVRIPIQLQYTWRAKKVITTFIIIAWISCTLCGYHLIEYQHGFTTIMNGTRLYAMPINIANIPNTSKTLLKFIKYWKTAQIIFTIIVPTICISILNIQIIFVLRKSEFLLLQQQQQQNSESLEHPAVRSRSSDHEARNRRDTKVTFTVLAIIGCYIVTHVPSAVPFVLEIFDKKSFFMMMYYQPLSNCWTLMGKVANFVLFCLSSVYFRKRLIKILKRRIDACPFLRRRKKKYSGVSSERSFKSQAIKLQKYKNGNDRDSIHRQSSVVTQLE